MTGLVLCEPTELYNILNRVTKLSRLTEPNYLCLLGKYFIYGCVGLSCGRWDLPLWWADSLVVVCGLSGSTACGILGIEPAPLALEEGFLTTGPPGKSQFHLFLSQIDHVSDLCSRLCDEDSLMLLHGARV